MTASAFILEDEPIIALELESCLSDAGYEVVGTAGSVEAALEQLRDLRCDVAVLDLNLHGQRSDAVAAMLADRGTPFLFVSGYGREALPARFAAAPLVPKPIHERALLDAMQSLLSQSAD